jgi:hypothetical protein
MFDKRLHWVDGGHECGTVVDVDDDHGGATRRRLRHPFRSPFSDDDGLWTLCLCVFISSILHEIAIGSLFIDGFRSRRRDWCEDG